MVRREGIAAVRAGTSGEGMPCCIFPAGESPDRVIAGELGSRPPPEVERPTGEAWCRKPPTARAVGWEQERGPQHQVKPAASSQLQSGSRAEHVAVKATQGAGKSGYAPSPGGVWGAARVQGTMRNTRGSSAPRVMPQSCLDKLMAKRGAAQRESEGAVVLVRTVQKNTVGGKGPCFSRAGEARRREGMTGDAVSNNPAGQPLGDKAPCLRDQLQGAAKPMVAQAVRRGLSVSRMREIRTYGLSGGPASGSGIQINELPAGGRIYQ
jgi:hypothetical protein